MPHLFIFAGLPMLALFLMGAMSVVMWLMSSGLRKLIGVAALCMLGAAWYIESLELVAGALALSICPLVFASLIDGSVTNTLELDSKLLYLKNVLIALDQLVNVLIGGSPDETLSSVAYRMSIKPDPHWRWRLARRCIDHLFWFEDDHCHQAYLAEVNRSQFTPDFH